MHASAPRSCHSIPLRGLKKKKLQRHRQKRRACPVRRQSLHNHVAAQSQRRSSSRRSSRLARFLFGAGEMPHFHLPFNLTLYVNTCSFAVRRRAMGCAAQGFASLLCHCFTPRPVLYHHIHSSLMFVQAMVAPHRRCM